MINFLKKKLTHPALSILSVSKKKNKKISLRHPSAVPKFISNITLNFSLPWDLIIVASS